MTPKNRKLYLFIILKKIYDMKSSLQFHNFISSIFWCIYIDSFRYGAESESTGICKNTVDNLDWIRTFFFCKYLSVELANLQPGIKRRGIEWKYSFCKVISLWNPLWIEGDRTAKIDLERYLSWLIPIERVYMYSAIGLNRIVALHVSAKIWSDLSREFRMWGYRCAIHGG